jgi:hypothetical protein
MPQAAVNIRARRNFYAEFIGARNLASNAQSVFSLRTENFTGGADYTNPLAVRFGQYSITPSSIERGAVDYYNSLLTMTSPTEEQMSIIGGLYEFYKNNTEIVVKAFYKRYPERVPSINTEGQARVFALNLPIVLQIPVEYTTCPSLRILKVAPPITVSIEQF